MKKYLSLFAVALIVGAFFVQPVRAETNPSSMQALIQSLMAQVQELQRQFVILQKTSSLSTPLTAVTPSSGGENWSNVCNDGKNYELTSNQRVYIGKIRKPTSYILPSGSITLGLRNSDTGETNYNLPYSYVTDQPSKISISGNTARDIVSTYAEYTIFMDISAPDLQQCRNIKQPMRVMTGDLFLGTTTAFIYPKNIIPSEVLPPGQNWGTTSVGKMMNRYNFVKVTDAVRSLEEKLFAHKALDGDAIVMGLMPPWCGGGGQPTGFSVGCLIQPNNQPHWKVVFHEIGHDVDNFNLSYLDGLGGSYSNNQYYFYAPNIYPLYPEAEATLAALYAERGILLNNQTYNFSENIINGITNEYNNAHRNYLQSLADYESSGSNFSTITPDVLDGIFLNLAENSSINKLGWEAYPKFFRIYQNPLPTFIQEPLTTLQYHTYFIAGLSAATGNDLRFLFKDRWHFPIDEVYFEQIYPQLISFLLGKSNQSLIKVLSPNGGETWVVGKQYTITWNAKTYPPNTPIQIGLRDSRYNPNLGEGEAVITNNATNTGKYVFTVPSSLDQLSGGTLGGQNVYSIVVYVDGGGPNKYDISDLPFSIFRSLTTSDNYIKVTNPNGGETLYTGKTATITWSSANLSSDRVTIRLASSCAGGWPTIVQDTSDDGSYTWNIPSTYASNICKYKIEVGAWYDDGEGPDVYDLSDDWFMIRSVSTTDTDPYELSTSKVLGASISYQDVLSQIATILEGMQELLQGLH